jgi:hypothetical protein
MPSLGQNPTTGLSVHITSFSIGTEPILQSAFFKISIAFTNSEKLGTDFEKTETSNPTKEKKASAIKIAIAASTSIRTKKEALPLLSQKSLIKRYKYPESNKVIPTF